RRSGAETERPRRQSHPGGIRLQSESDRRSQGGRDRFAGPTESVQDWIRICKSNGRKAQRADATARRRYGRGIADARESRHAADAAVAEIALKLVRGRWSVVSCS